MDKSDKIIFWFAIIITVQTVQTWFHLGWYWFDISTATIIATLVLCLSFLTKLWFVEYFLIYLYYIKLTNIISMYAVYGNSKYVPFLNASKPYMIVILYIWFAYVSIKYAKGWEYKSINN